MSEDLQQELSNLIDKFEKGGWEPIGVMTKIIEYIAENPTKTELWDFAYSENNQATLMRTILELMDK